MARGLKVMMLGAAALACSACATVEQQRAATTGAMIGAAAGAAIGADSGQAAEGAVIGGAIGALAGAILAENNAVQASGPAYHRRACAGGAPYFNRARHARNMDRQIMLMRQGLSYCPNNPAAHNDLGVALLVRGAPGDVREARMHFRRALALDPGYEPARRNLMRLRGMHAPARGAWRGGHRRHDRDEEHRGYWGEDDRED